jgi:hypothetical protein
LIEIVDAESGDKVIRYDGRLLASRFDPKKEAQEWLNGRGDFLANVRTVIVLGLGSGHHISALLEKTGARILVLEANEEIFETGQTIQTFDPLKVRIEHVTSAKALRSSDAVKAAVKESFVVLVHPASQSLNFELFENCRAQLLGRDWGSLNWQWNLRGAPAFDANPRVDSKSEDSLTIYDLEQTELVQNSEEREKLLFKALRELVK